MLTVMVPVFVPVVPGVVVIAAGPENVTVAPVTLKISPLLVPFVVVTVTLLVPGAGALAMVNVAVTVVAVDATLLMVMPGIGFTVAPVKFVPVRVTVFIVVPRAPEAGLMVVSVGASEVTEKFTVLVVPFGVVTLTVLATTGAVAEIVKVAST